MPHSAALLLTAMRDSELIPVPHTLGRVDVKALLISNREVNAVCADQLLGNTLVSALYCKDSVIRLLRPPHSGGREP